MRRNRNQNPTGLTLGLLCKNGIAAWDETKYYQVGIRFSRRRPDPFSVAIGGGRVLLRPCCNVDQVFSDCWHAYWAREIGALPELERCLPPADPGGMERALQLARCLEIIDDLVKQLDLVEAGEPLDGRKPLQSSLPESMRTLMGDPPAAGAPGPEVLRGPHLLWFDRVYPLVRKSPRTKGNSQALRVVLESGEYLTQQNGALTSAEMHDAWTAWVASWLPSRAAREDRIARVRRKIVRSLRKFDRHLADRPREGVEYLLYTSPSTWEIRYGVPETGEPYVALDVSSGGPYIVEDEHGAFYEFPDCRVGFQLGLAALSCLCGPEFVLRHRLMPQVTKPSRYSHMFVDAGSTVCLDDWLSDDYQWPARSTVAMIQIAEQTGHILRSGYVGHAGRLKCSPHREARRCGRRKMTLAEARSSGLPVYRFERPMGNPQRQRAR